MKIERGHTYIQSQHTLSGSIGHDARDYEEHIAVTPERSVLETMAATSASLETVERKVERIAGYLFGSEPQCDECQAAFDTNVRAMANHAQRTTETIEHMLDRIYQRLVE